MPADVIVFGATGKVGSCLVNEGLAAGLDVSVFVRDPRKLALQHSPQVVSRLKVYVGDVHDRGAVSRATSEHHTAVDAAGSGIPKEYLAIRRSIMSAAREALQPPRRIWVFGGLPGLLVPHTDTPGTDLPGMPALFRAHRPVYEALRESGLDWTFICPGPMYLAGRRGIPGRLKVTFDVMPYRMDEWTKRLPRIAHPFIMYSHLRELATAYEDVACLVMNNLAPGGPYSGRRIGVVDRQA
jgi:putative NADH-flavin reductase